MTALLSLQGVSKHYGATQALRDVSFDLAAGHCLAVAGENGAGKSTLMRIISGVETPSRGVLKVRGETCSFGTPRAARREKIFLIPQELAYVPDLSVAENIALANWDGRRVFASRRRMVHEAERALAPLGLDIDVRSPMTAIGLAERQLVEIAKALSTSARLVILDEPTASLQAREVERLLELLHELKDQGVALIYVSHHLEECFAVADRFLVLRDGRMVADKPKGETSTSEVVGLMLGSEYVEAAPVAREGATGSPGTGLRARGWRVAAKPPLRDVSFEVDRGEVLGIYGLLGSGTQSIARGLGGQIASLSGTVEVAGGSRARAPRRPTHSRRLGIAYVPAERKTEGLALGRPIAETLLLQTPEACSRFGLVNPRREARAAAKLAARFDVRCESVRQSVGQLSGGNQQRVLLASRLAASPRILVLHEPTRGVDVGARSQIHTMVTEAATQSAVILITSDVAEAVALSSRLLVLREGRIVTELTGDGITEHTAVQCAAGGAL
jgi:ABC-type sugar transport system ATPase subunit